MNKKKGEKMDLDRAQSMHYRMLEAHEQDTEEEIQYYSRAWRKPKSQKLEGSKMHPLIMKPWSVRQIIDGFKTETRRLITSRLEKVQVGNVFWVKESTFSIGLFDDSEIPFKTLYQADFLDQPRRTLKWKSPLLMKKEACRLFLRVTGKRKEYLQDIDEDGALAEGIRMKEGIHYPHFPHFHSRKLKISDTSIHYSAKISFRTLWDCIAKPGAKWVDDPEVFVFKFAKMEGKNERY